MKYYYFHVCGTIIFNSIYFKCQTTIKLRIKLIVRTQFSNKPKHEGLNKKPKSVTSVFASIKSRCVAFVFHSPPIIRWNRVINAINWFGHGRASSQPFLSPDHNPAFHPFSSHNPVIRVINDSTQLTVLNHINSLLPPASNVICVLLPGRMWWESGFA